MVLAPPGSCVAPGPAREPEFPEEPEVRTVSEGLPCRAGTVGVGNEPEPEPEFPPVEVFAVVSSSALALTLALATRKTRETGRTRAGRVCFGAGFPS